LPKRRGQAFIPARERGASKAKLKAAIGTASNTLLNQVNHQSLADLIQTKVRFPQNGLIKIKGQYN